MSTAEIRALVEARRETAGQHDTTQTILEGLLARIEALESQGFSA